MTMKLRNRLIALVCLILFLSIGLLLLLSSGHRKPFAVILFVTDNLNPSSLTAARLYAGGGDARLQIEDFPNTALCRNSSMDFSVPDAASSATQIAGGKKVPKGRLCMDEGGGKMPSLLEKASLKGRSVGLISTGSIDSPGAASFFAKSPDSGNSKDIVDQFRSHAPYDFVALAASDSSKDIQPHGVTISKSMEELMETPFWKRDPILAFLPETGSGDRDGNSLSELVRRAIRRLEVDRNGYLLVVDDSSVGEAAKTNDGELMLNRIAALDDAILTARRYAGENATIVVTGRENIGGMQLNGYPFLHDKGVAVLALNNLGYPSLCWATGPGYAVEEPAKTKSSKTQRAGILSQPSAFTAPAATATAGDVIAAGTGPGTGSIHGFLDLTDIHRILSEAL